MKRLGLLICDEHDPAFVERVGTYAQDFKNMLESVAPDEWEYQIWHCPDHELPVSSDDCDAWIVSGSKAAAYDKDTWIESLKLFIQQLDQAEAKVVGVCFGHQVIHSALGGQVEKYFDGWGLGPYPVTLSDKLGELQAGDDLRVLAMHQDQVLNMAEGFTTIATSDFCSNAITRKGGHILTIQAHPEFSNDLFASICPRIREKAGEQRINQALIEMAKVDDRMVVRKQIADFLSGKLT
ncbi:hypothetical protein ACH42_13285 [Endozoicomonas sp. (ex Bugula neritina AB1)]|nr:hypothetical protein ACH42_13285 [Endozoicomonas sp. (ex Bugula neritina AB1)]